MKQFIVPALVASGLLAHTYADDASLKAFNPAVSVIVDGMYYHENSEEGMGHLKEEISGFGHAHAGEEHAHEHGMENGFNLRHLEIQFSAEVDSYFKASAIAAISASSYPLKRRSRPKIQRSLKARSLIHPLRNKNKPGTLRRKKRRYWRERPFSTKKSRIPRHVSPAVMVPSRSDATMYFAAILLQV